jgi:hypothetical protein
MRQIRQNKKREVGTICSTMPGCFCLLVSLLVKALLVGTKKKKTAGSLGHVIATVYSLQHCGIKTKKPSNKFDSFIFFYMRII